MKLITKLLLLSVSSLMFTTITFANIRVEDHTKRFIDDYYHLKNTSHNARRNFILHYELVSEPRTCRIFFDGHPIPRDPRIEVMLDKYADNLPSIVKSYEQKAPEVKAIAAEVQDRTQRLFGMKINANVILSTSVSPTDAVTTGNGYMTPTVALNMKEMARYSKDELRIVIAHELFHVLQHQIENDHSGSDMIAGNLYSEGWATYASSLVYPGFSDWKYISYFTKNDHQFRKFEFERKDIIQSLLHDRNSHNERKYDKYFSGDNFASRPFEPRSGYYIGYLAAKRLAEKRPAIQVALISYNDFKKQIKPLLKEMSEVG